MTNIALSTDPIASIKAMQARRRARAKARTGGKPWTVYMTRKGGQQCDIRCEDHGPVTFKTFWEAEAHRTWMHQQFGDVGCVYEVRKW